MWAQLHANAAPGKAVSDNGVRIERGGLGESRGLCLSPVVLTKR